MNLDSIRKLCLSLPCATENLQWEDELCFKVGGKIFAMIGISSVPQRLVFKCDPEKFAELTEREGIIPAPYVGRYKWVMLESLDALPSGELKQHIRESYSMVAAKAPKKARLRPGRSKKRSPPTRKKLKE
ncbi:MAG TPA: MmcQ/YjbR family DNA-binding protein [Terriglobales bacterium]|nr:MmcQ/YjbR family DNA-binding protein [Terriglobales bacterium]